MPFWAALTLFATSIGVLSWASVRLTMALENIGARLRFSEGLLGIVTALGADAPEICSAFAALLSHQHEVGYGVVLGSNIFNLAGLLGLSGLVAGSVKIGRAGLWLNGGTSLLVSAVVVALLLAWIPVGASLGLLLLLLTPYVGFTALRARQIARLKLPRVTRRFLAAAIGHVHRAARKQRKTSRTKHPETGWLLLSLFLVIAASVAAVHSAVRLGILWGVSTAVVGTLVLAALTSIPNVIAAVRLAREGRGAAVVSESLNSNTLNILAGICLPALLIGFVRPSPQILFAAFWLLGMKLFALGAISRRHGLSRASGVVLIGVYIVFAAVIIGWK